MYALIDHNSDGVADKKIVIAEGLNMPSGLAIKEGDFTVAASYFAQDVLLEYLLVFISMR